MSIRLDLVLLLLLLTAGSCWADSKKTGAAEEDSKTGSAKEAPDNARHSDDDKKGGKVMGDAGEQWPQQWRVCAPPKQPPPPSPAPLDCRKRALLEVPKNAPPGVTAVRLGGNLFRHLRQVQLPGVRRLELDRCHIATITEYALAQAPDLEHLDLTANQLTELPRSLLSRTTDLRDIQLAQNQLTALPELPCKRLQALKSLNLAANKVVHLRVPADYADCKSLGSLTLSNNRGLRTIESGNLAAFTSQRRLHTLRLAGCPIEKLDTDALEPVRDSLRHLDLSGSRVPPDQLLEALGRLAGLHWLRLHRVNLPQLLSKDLRREGLVALRSLQVTCANANGQPLSLASSRTFSAGAQHLEQLQLDSCGLASFDWQVAGLTSLQALDLARNRLAAVPKALPAALKRLNLRGNRISDISGTQMFGLVSLEWLELDGNPIKSLAGAFDFVCRTPALAELVLDARQLAIFQQRGRFNGAPPAFPVEAIAIRGKKHKKALRSYTTELLSLVHTRCLADPPEWKDPEPNLPPEPLPEDRGSGLSGDGRKTWAGSDGGERHVASSGAGGSSVVLKVLAAFFAIGVAALVIFLVYKNRSRLPCRRSSHQALRGAGEARARANGNSSDHLGGNFAMNRMYSGGAGATPGAPPEQQQQLAQSSRSVRHGGHGELARETTQQQQQQQQQQEQQQGLLANSTDDSERSSTDPYSVADLPAKVADEAAAEASRLSRAEGGRVSPSPSLVSCPQTVLLVGLQSDLAVHINRRDEPGGGNALNVVEVDENSSKPETAEQTEKIFVMLSSELLNNQDLMSWLEELLSHSRAKKKTKILCLPKGDSPEFTKRMRRGSQNLHKIYTQYPGRLISWWKSGRTLQDLAVYV